MDKKPDMVLSQYGDMFPERRIPPPILTLIRGVPRHANAHQHTRAVYGSERANDVQRDCRATETEAGVDASLPMGLSSEKYMINK